MEYQYINSKNLKNCPQCLSENYDILKGKIEVFRLTPNKECDKNDFLPFILKAKDRCNKNCKESKIKCCLCYGLSVETDIEEIKRKNKKFPKLGNNIFCAIIEKEGLIYSTPSKRWPKHSTFFIYKNFEECNIFNFKETLKR